MDLAKLISLGLLSFFSVSIFWVNKPRRFYLLFVICFLPVIDLPVTPASFGSFRLFDAVSFIMFLILFKDIISTSRALRNYFIIFSILLTSLFIGSLFSEFISNSILGLLSFVSIFIYAKLFLLECSDDKNFEKKVLFFLKGVGILSLIFLLIQLFVGTDFTFYQEVNRNTQDFRGIRYPSFFHDPQKFQQFLSMLSFLFLINYNHPEEPSLKNYMFFLIILLGMIATGGRSAFIGLIAAILLLLMFAKNKFRLSLLGFCVAGSMAIMIFSDSLLFLKRSETITEDYVFRASLWEEAYNVYKNHPLFGIGIGNFYKYSIAHSNNYFINEKRDVVFFDQPESGYWMMLTETGAIGCVVLFSFIIVPIVKLFRNGLRYNRNFFLFYIASITCWLVSFASLYSISDKRILLVLVTLVCLLIKGNTLSKDAI